MGAPRPTPPPTPQAQPQPTTTWHSYDLPFRVLNIASDGRLLWICGTEEAIAVSDDSGEHWQVKHIREGSSRSLLHVDFVDSKFGYATGTEGTFLTTADGGETWLSRPGVNETIMQASLADSEHALIQTTSALLLTVDGGSHWSPVPAGQTAEGIEGFPYVFSLVALDKAHMAVMLKQGPAQYYAQAFFVTEDSGRSWTFLNLPNVTLYSFLRAGGQYWAVGTEVVHKDQPGGGYAVPVALYSSDGRNWSHSTGDLSACKPALCTACTNQGCFASKGVIAQIFVERTICREFPPVEEPGPRWASTDSTICFVGHRLQCAPLK